MKYVAFIGLGLVLLLTICGVVLWANMPTARLTVHLVRPTGTNFAFATSIDGAMPVWECAITNCGRAPALWSTELVITNGFQVTHQRWHRGDFPMMGTLVPGAWTNIGLPLPLGSNSGWNAVVTCSSSRGRVERKLFDLFKPVPTLRRLLPNYGPRVSYTAPHSTNNVTTDH